MRIALGSDEATELTASLAADLRTRGYAVSLYGALNPADDKAWPAVGRRIGEAVASAQADYGVVCCWTGTGVSIAANKVPGVRAALCCDAETASGARKWNDANVLALSLSNTPIATAHQILNAWFSSQASADPLDRAMIEELE